ncbi:MAG: pentapeptide repeat-containing protein [Firmicutes bacterium]|nr:pentapeptide repeat-containing protein [[Eubacterium] siraeum]MCM1488145.1 pentapeptide repeat-containing protein [Bacillota bacterium]
MITMFNLWFNNNKISDLQQLKEHFDFDIAKMYLLGGSLTAWLEQCGEADLARRVNYIDLNGSIYLQLSEIFDIKLPDSCKAQAAEQEEDAAENKPIAVNRSKSPSSLASEACMPSSFEDQGLKPSSFAQSSFRSAENSYFLESLSASFTASSFELSSAVSSFGAFGAGSFEFNTVNSFSNQLLSSFEQRSVNIGAIRSSNTFFYSSFNIGSFGEHEYEYEYEYGGSFAGLTAGSFNAGSFNIGLFNVGSFNAGSFNIGSYASDLTAEGSFAAAPDNDAANGGKTVAKPEKIFLPKAADDLSPEEKIKQNIQSCPLNRFGYGIHLI